MNLSHTTRCLALTASCSLALVGAFVPGAAAAPLYQCGKPIVDTDGSIQNVICGNGQLNENPKVAALLRKEAPATMAVSPSATWRTLRKAMCKDLEQADSPVMIAVYLYKDGQRNDAGVSEPAWPSIQRVETRITDGTLCG
ncbi:MAG: hypothetical protein Q7V58_12330 [Actinomycetota bacterium]|nr:hypothetical protein [Actinomycetota bacterium]